MDRHRILIVGAGELGKTLGKYTAVRGHEVLLWDIDRARSVEHRPAHELAPLADVIFLCVPSWAIRSVLSDIGAALHLSAIVAAFSKGLDGALGVTTGELLPELLPKGQPFVVVGGPMLAEEMAAGRHAAAVFASPDRRAADTVVGIFASKVFRAELSHDVHSVALAGVLKNIYAMALGISDGLGLGENAKGWLAARAVHEMLGIGEILGADREVILGTAGLADLVATGYSATSRNRGVGHEIATTGVCTIKSEGMASLPPLLMRLDGRAQEFPLLGVLKEVVLDCLPAAPAMERYLRG